MTLSNSELPQKYQNEAHKKQWVNVKHWLNFSDDRDEGEYIDQSFYLPSPVDDKNLYAMVGRQSLRHVAIAHMRFGYKRINQICDSQPDMGEVLKQLFLDEDTFDEFEQLVLEHEGWVNMPKRLEQLGDKYFPFDEE